MRGLQLPLTQPQKIRLQGALEKLESRSLKTNSNASVTGADTIPVSGIATPYSVGGHGTLDVDGEVIATVCRVVERINKLVYVRTLRVRYKPEVGDIVVGRVIERRRTVEDELNMQVVSEENNFICAEVRGLLLGEISNTLVCSLFPMFMTNLMRGNS